MKRMMKTLAVLATFALTAVTSAQASNPTGLTSLEMQQPKQYVVVDGVNVRLRFEPNLNSSWLHYDNGKARHAPKGTKLTYLGEKDDFYYVEYAGYKVYIAKQYSHLVSDTQEVKKPAKEGNYFVVVNGTNVRLREGPSTKHKYFTWDDGSPCYLPKGTYLKYLGMANDFYKCDYQGKTVYISKKYSYVTK